MEVVLKMPFLSLNNADVEFAELKRLIWRIYTAAEVLPIINRVKLINKREFAKAALKKNFETFVMHVATLEMPTAMSIHSSRTLQVQRLNEPTLAALQWDKAPIEIPAKYADYADVFSLDLAMKLLENTKINEHAIKLIDGK